MGEEVSKKRDEKVDMLGLVSLGFFFIFVGAIWIVTPNLTEEVVDFFKDFQLVKITQNIVFPAPAQSHPVVYTAAMQFCLTFGAFQIIILILRFVFRDSLKRKAETFSGIVFWFIAGFFLHMLIGEALSWFGFIAGLIIACGAAVTASSIVKLLG